MKIMTVLLFLGTLGYAQNMDDYIIKDLDFYTNLEMIENQDLAANIDQIPAEKDTAVDNEQEDKHVN